MTDNQSRSRGILRLRHLQEVYEAKAEEMAAMAPRFQAMAKPGAAPRVITAFNLFQTTEPIADLMAEQFPLASGPLRWLEPSAGLGRLYHAARRRCPAQDGDQFTLIDESRELAAELYRITEQTAGIRLICGDFLAQTPEKLGEFDRIIMNPPFKMWRDLKHIKHAASLLAPGGILVALCANGPRQRDHLQPIATIWQELPAGSFRSEGTGVDVAMMTIHRE